MPKAQFSKFCTHCASSIRFSVTCICICIFLFEQIQTQECQRIMDEADKEHKKMFDRINEGREAMKVGTPFLGKKM